MWNKVNGWMQKGKAETGRVEEKERQAGFTAVMGWILFVRRPYGSLACHPKLGHMTHN